MQRKLNWTYLVVGMVLVIAIGSITYRSIKKEGRLNGGEKMKDYKEVVLLDTSEHMYTNPLAIQYIGDPFVLHTKDKYYCFATSAHNGYKVWSSDNLVSWNMEGMAYKRGKEAWSGSDYWAPEVVESNGQYYMFYTAKTIQNPTLRIGLAVSKNPEGPYVDIDNKPFFEPGYAVIDASIWLDEDGRNYMYYAVDCSENIVNGKHESHIAVVELSQDLRQVIGESTTLLKPDQMWEQYSGNEWAWNEGPIVMKREGKYYLFYSANFFADRTYSVGYAISDSPLGPFVKQQEPLLWHTPLVGKDSAPVVSGPGHNSLTVSPDGSELFIVYHTHMDPKNPSGDRQMAIDRIGFRADGMLYANGPTAEPQPVPSGSNGYQKIMPDRVVANTAQAEALMTGEAKLFETTPIWQGEKDDTLTLEWDTLQDIGMIAFYPPFNEETQVFDVILNDEFIISDVTVTSDPAKPGNCKIVAFDPLQTKQIQIIFKNSGHTAALSQIMVFSR